MKVLYCKKACKTGKFLKNHFKSKFKDLDVVLRYGSIKRYPAEYSFNTIEGINNCRHKFFQYVILEANGLRTPIRRIDLIQKWWKEGKLEKLFFKKGHADLDFFTVKLNIKHEYRLIYVFGDYIVAVKKPKEDTDYIPFLRKWETGWKFIYSENLKGPVLTDIVNKIAESMKLHFFGADIAKTKKNNFFILEVNSAPGLNIPKTREFFIERTEDFFRRL